MIMRTWRGAVRAVDAERYLEHQAATGIAEYRSTRGNRGALVLSRRVGELCEVTTVSFWDSLDAIRGFAGEDPEVAKFYPGDDDLLVEKDLRARHHDVVSADVEAAALHVPAAG